MTRADFIKNYWDYYLSLENRMLQTSSYVAIDPDNSETFSNEYAILLQAIGGELDTFFKEYCGFNPDDIKNVTDYAKFILHDYPDIVKQSISILGTNMKITPFNGWDRECAKKSLQWWKAYDDIKHSRYANKKVACQKNVLNILASLFLMEMKYLQKLTYGKDQPDVPDKISKLFSLDEWVFHYIPLNGVMALIDGEICVGNVYEENGDA